MLRSVDAQSDSTSLPQSQTALPEVSVIVADAEVEDAEVDEADLVVASVIAGDVVAVAEVDEVALEIVEDVVVDAVEAQTVVVSETSRDRRRLSKSVETLLPLWDNMWAVGFVGCGLLTILLHGSCGI